MRIAVSSCWHIDLVVNGYDFHEDIARAASRMIEETYRVDLFVHLGDLFNSSRPTPRGIAFALSIFNQIGCPAIILAGNHDISSGMKPSALEPLKVVQFKEEVKIIEIPTVLRVSDAANIALVPYMSDGRAFKEGGHQTAQDWVNEFFDHVSTIENVQAVFTHLDVEGVDLGNGVKMHGASLGMPLQKAKKLASIVMNGHIHKGQKIEPNIIMPGSIVPTSSIDYDRIEEIRQCYAVIEI